jgi:multiple sugar transport system ATP-binding protein
MASIAFSEVSKVFPDGTKAVDGLDLEIPDGGFTVLVGPSGSGKSTALRMVAGLEEASSGTIRIADRVVNDVAPKDRDIAMVFQSYALYPHMSVQDNLGFALKMQSVEKSSRFGRVGGVAKRLGISEQLERRPRQLSGGQRQRVALGRAIVREPQAFLMDEPLSNLDAKLRVEMRAYLARLHQELGTTTLYVTHDQTEAMTMGDRVAVMRDGRLEQVDAPQALYDCPANLFVAAFIGSPAMNLLRGRLELIDGRVHAVLGGQRLVLPDEVLDARPVLGGWVDDDVVIGIRPEAVHVANGVTTGVELELEVSLVESLGSDVLVHLRTDAPRVTVSDAFDGEDDAGLEARFTARLPPFVDAAVGDRLRLAIDTERLHVFDPETGLALR